jgi:hypothetical protein
MEKSKAACKRDPQLEDEEKTAYVSLRRLMAAHVLPHYENMTKVH